jgi:8-amino-7-oxononanoate synthase
MEAVRREAVVDFASTHYLGLRHPSARLRGWRALTAGVPAALHPLAGTNRLQARVAALCAAQAASLATSTLHLVWDVFGQFSAQGVSLYLDRGAYETLRWGAERAAGRGVPVWIFDHHNPHALAAALAADRSGRPAVVACDGLCPRCGKSAPLAAYLDAVAARRGRVVIDDTQAMGILGATGGGTRIHLGLDHPGLLVIASFAKGFGAPIAAVLGSTSAVDAYERASACRVHSSPPSSAALRALDRALRVNAIVGDVLRARLADRIARFRAGVHAAGLEAAGGSFPVQVVTGIHRDPRAVHEALRRAGVRTVLRHGPKGPELCFVLSARHRVRDIDRALDALIAAAGTGRAGP